jgi:ribose transport system ATP-binding protein
MSARDEFVLSMRNINKSFSGVQVLYDINLDIRRGEVHVLVGENGAGKSTLMKIITGAYEKDSGEIFFEGRSMNLRRAREAQELGIGIIHQEFNLLPQRTVGQNIFLGREPLKNKVLGTVDERTINEKSREFLDYLGLDIDPRRKIAGLGVAQQQMVEVAKAVSFKSKVLIMDEPTATLTSKEIAKLFEMIGKLRSEGVSIIYISHRLEELKQIADRITVLRDGRTVKTVEAAAAGIDEIIRLMVGREITNQYPRDYNEPGDELLRVNGLASYRFRDINLNVRQGEIVGISGLVGAGRTELLKAIFGDEVIERGTVGFFGREYGRMNTVLSTGLKVGLVPEDRKDEGTAISKPLRENIVQASMKRLFKNGILSRKVEKQYAEKYVDALNIKTTSIDKPVNLLSGGNQQKVVIAKWMCAECDFILFDEPTRGIDVGARSEIYSIMNGFVKGRRAILMVSSDLPELLGMCDRIYVMKDGKFTADFSRGEATQEKILAVSV